MQAAKCVTSGLITLSASIINLPSQMAVGITGIIRLSLALLFLLYSYLKRPFHCFSGSSLVI